MTNDSRKSHGHCFSRLPGCAGQAADSVPAYTQVKRETKNEVIEEAKNVHFFVVSGSLSS